MGEVVKGDWLFVALPEFKFSDTDTDTDTVHNFKVKYVLEKKQWL